MKNEQQGIQYEPRPVDLSTRYRSAFMQDYLYPRGQGQLSAVEELDMDLLASQYDSGDIIFARQQGISAGWNDVGSLQGMTPNN